VLELKRAPGDDILVFGSGTLATALAQHRLIDEFQFAVAPVILGQGRTLISGAAMQAPLSLIESRALDGGHVLLRYELPK
jgi:dihydrofolate reductase